MKINEDNILNDMGKIYSLTSNPSYSKDKMYNDDYSLFNYLYGVTFKKYFMLPNIDNPYYDKLYWRDHDKDLDELAELIPNYKYYYLESAKNYLKILEDNNFFHVPYRCKKTYEEPEFKELLLDFFNDEGVDKYGIVKSLFDEERVTTSLLKDYDCAGFCAILSSNIKPYVVVDNPQNKLKLVQGMHFAHEFGHAIEAHYILNRYNEFYKSKNLLLSEVSSKFYELEFLRYLERNRIGVKDTPNLINYYHSMAHYFLKDLLYTDSKNVTLEDVNYTSSSEEIYINDDKDIVRAFKKEGEENGEDYFLELEFFDPFIYGFGSYLSLHLFELKKQDPKEFNKTWNYYLSTRTLMSYEEIFNLFGLNIDEFISGKLIEPVIKEDLYNYRKQLTRKNDIKG